MSGEISQSRVRPNIVLNPLETEDDCDRTEPKSVRPSIVTFQIPQCKPHSNYKFHIVRPETQHKDHQDSECRLGKTYRHPLPRSNPFSLQALARAEICETYTYDKITTMTKEGLLTRNCQEYIQEGASNVRPTKRDIMFCEEYRFNKYLINNYKNVRGNKPLEISEAINAKDIIKA